MSEGVQNHSTPTFPVDNVINENRANFMTGRTKHQTHDHVIQYINDLVAISRRTIEAVMAADVTG
jgi:hypothetical protein